MENIFWISANIIFELQTGKTTDVLTLVNRMDDATVFGTQDEAEKYLQFVQVRAPRIRWDIVPPTPQRLGFIIRGLQVTGGRW